jgi:16S rRNA (cytosine967-C5)-methyltransferase
VAPGGALVYLTCTMNPAENGEVVETFLAGHSNFRLERVRATPLDSPLAEFFWGAVLRHR